uniref:Reverse transcriptase domain-containing protein n=1 Tax=Salarias fasciatus TaxID=181472 RepID=A0A672GYN6_SALFA
MNVVPQKFNNFFVNIGPELASKIPDGDDDHQFIKSNPNSMFLRAVDEVEIVNIVRNCKNKTSTDCDGVDMMVVKKVINEISKPLAHIFNLSFQTGTFPSKMKIAKVVPLYKTGNKHHFTNYRPVSVLPQFAQILEKLFNDRLDSFINKHHILSECQYGFRPQRSTSLALIDTIEEITKSLDNKKIAIGIFIDLKKAFDTLNHKILLHKLELYGIRGVALQWVESYLTNGHQFVRLAENCSSFRCILCGVPQGSVLGPKFFILYINNICNVSKLMKLVLFADDTNIFLSDTNLQKLLNNVATEFGKLKSWFNKNKLSLNLSKTTLMIFGNKKINAETDILIDDITIERVKETKFLGVIIDEKLSRKAHIKHVQSKLARSIGVLAKARHVLDITSLKLLYHSLVSPYLSYCAEVWGNNYKTAIQPIITLQKRAIRIVHKVAFRDHTNSLFFHSKLLKFIDIVEYLTVQLMYRASNNQLPVQYRVSVSVSTEDEVLVLGIGLKKSGMEHP